jgi:cytochrome c oxidase subunit II
MPNCPLTKKTTRAALAHRASLFPTGRRGTFLADLLAVFPPVFLALLAAVAGFPAAAFAQAGYNLQTPATGIAQQIFDLHNMVSLVCLAIFVVVFIPMGIALWRDRKSVGHVAHRFHDNVKLELAWTVVPILVLVGMAWPATRAVVEMKDTRAPDMTIKVTGYQWKWEYEYLGDGIRYISNLATPKAQIDNVERKSNEYLLEVDHPLVVPTGQKIRLVLTSSDVIHSWWVPALGVKQDTIPGFVRDAWFRVDQPGIYRGQCVELCGVGHAFMPVVVEAVTPERFTAWREEQKTLAAAAAAEASKTFTLAEQMERGGKIYAANCASCHQATGAGLPPAFPALDKSPVAVGPLGPHIDVVFNGRPGTAMAAFGKQLSDVDVAAVVTYERNSWNNKTGDVVQPKQIAALRGK